MIVCNCVLEGVYCGLCLSLLLDLDGFLLAFMLSSMFCWGCYVSFGVALCLFALM